MLTFSLSMLWSFVLSMFYVVGSLVEIVWEIDANLFFVNVMELCTVYVLCGWVIGVNFFF